MLALAAARGIEVVQAVAEALPFAAASFDQTLVVTTICFVDSPARMLAEAYRLLRPGRHLVLGFIDRESSIGREYLAHQAESTFYREATFYSGPDAERPLWESGFAVRAWEQTLSGPLAKTRVIEPLQPGHGRCAFAVVSARRAC